VLTNVAGCPLAVEVFEGNTGDPKTLANQIAKLRGRFGLERIVLVGDRGMITEARIREDLAPQQLEWISALRAPAIAALLEQGALQLCLFDERDLAEISSAAFPGERLIVCKNPQLARSCAQASAARCHRAGAGEDCCGHRGGKRRLRGQAAVHCAWAKCSTTTRWASTFGSPSKTAALLSCAMRRPLLARRR
jgi:hypothetical protein